MNIFIAIILDSFGGQTDAFNLPVFKNDIEDFVAVWARYDPLATGFIETAKLEKFMEDVAEDVPALFFNKTVRKRVGNLNVTEEMTDQEVEKVLRNNKYHRTNFMMSLEIPTYDNFKYIFFYDTLQTMTQKIVEYNYEREKIDTIKTQLKAVEMLQFDGPRVDKSYTM